MRGLLDFLFPRQLRRLPYFIRVIICNALIFSLGTYLSPENLSEWCGWLVVDAYTAVFVMLPRIRDIGMSPLWIILAFIPYVNVFLGAALLFRRSNPQHNPLLHRPPPLDATASPAAGRDPVAG